MRNKLHLLSIELKTIYWFKSALLHLHFCVFLLRIVLYFWYLLKVLSKHQATLQHPIHKICLSWKYFFLKLVKASTPWNTLSIVNLLLFFLNLLLCYISWFIFLLKLIFSNGLSQRIFVFLNIKVQRSINYLFTFKIDHSYSILRTREDKMATTLISIPFSFQNNIQNTFHLLTIALNQLLFFSMVTNIVEVDSKHCIFGICLENRQICRNNLHLFFFRFLLIRFISRWTEFLLKLVWFFPTIVWLLIIRSWIRLAIRWRFFRFGMLIIVITIFVKPSTKSIDLKDKLAVLNFESINSRNHIENLKSLRLVPGIH